jgi:PAS domain S-box-containing protein
MDEQGTIDFWNPGAQRVFGYSAAEMIGADAAVLFTPEDRAAGVPADELRRAVAEGRASDERFHIRKDGSRFYCSGVTTKIGAGLGLAKIARDLSAQRAAELALQEARNTLERGVLERTLALQGEVARRDAAQADVVRLLRKLVTAQETERRRIARDLHDHLGQQLTALRLTLDGCRSQVGSAAAGEIERALVLTRQIDEAVDFLAWELRPAVLDDLGLVAALPRFLEQWSEHSGVLAEFRCSGLSAGQLSGDAEVALYRITQEALNNVAKHAHASRVDVILERHDDDVVLIIEDDGIGFDPSHPDIARRGIGLAGMRERAALIGAQLEVESSVGKGSSVFVSCAVELNGGDMPGAM